VGNTETLACFSLFHCPFATHYTTKIILAGTTLMFIHKRLYRLTNTNWMTPSSGEGGLHSCRSSHDRRVIPKYGKNRLQATPRYGCRSLQISRTFQGLLGSFQGSSCRRRQCLKRLSRDLQQPTPCTLERGHKKDLARNSSTTSTNGKASSADAEAKSP